MLLFVVLCDQLRALDNFFQKCILVLSELLYQQDAASECVCLKNYLTLEGIVE